MPRLVSDIFPILVENIKYNKEVIKNETNIYTEIQILASEGIWV